MSFTLGQNFLKTRGGNTKPARSLIELTGDKNIFKILHVAFVWTLKACGSRISETLLEGPPTEDSIIDMENQEGRIYFTGILMAFNIVSWYGNLSVKDKTRLS